MTLPLFGALPAVRRDLNLLRHWIISHQIIFLTLLQYIVLVNGMNYYKRLS